MSLPPFCDDCGGNRGLNPVGQTCRKCVNDELRKCRKEHIRKDEFDPANPLHFKLQSRGGAWRYYRKVGPVVLGVDVGKPGGDMSVKVTRRGDEILSIETINVGE